jgi:hypothetical protein
VTFTAQSKQLASDPNIRACASGCDMPTQSTSGSKQGSYFKQYVSGYQSTQVGGSIHIALTSARHCDVQPYVCGGQSYWPGGLVEFYDGNTGFDCKLNIGYMNVGASANVGGCYYSTRTNPLGAGSIGGNATGVVGYAPDNEGFFSFSNNYWQSTNGYYYPTQGDCDFATNQAYPAAQSAAQGAINAWAGGNTVVQSNIGRGSSSCNPGVGQPGGSVTGNTNANYSATSYSPQGARNVAASRLNGMLPSGYYWSAGPTACNPTWSYSGAVVAIQCGESGTGTADWRDTSSAGQQTQAALKAQIAGKPKATAVSICNSFAGVVPGTCSITFTGGNVSIVPTSASNIQIRAG